MKHIIYLLLLVIVTGFTQCCKEKPTSNNTDTPGLPPATQTGANTFGCLLNGEPWMPQGNNGSGNNLSIDFDPGFNNGVFGIAAYKAVLGMPNTQGIGIGVKDSLNNLNFPKTFTFSRTSLFRASADKDVSCMLLSVDLNTSSTGELTISKLDRQNRIIAGRFNFTLHQNGCDTLKVTNGRFDMKF